jgi:hypothetical protein
MKNLFSSKNHICNTIEDTNKFFNSILLLTIKVFDMYMKHNDTYKLILHIYFNNTNNKDIEIMISFKYYENNNLVKKFKKYNILQYNIKDTITNVFYSKYYYYFNYLYKKIPNIKELQKFKDIMIFDKELLILLELRGYSTNKILLD